MLTTFDYSRCSLKLKRPEEASGHGSGDGNGAPVLSTEAFRILKIHPGKQDSDIVCNLTVHKLLNAQNTAFPDPPRYDALSYTWGPQHGDKRVRILESNNIHDLPVGPNLDSALRQFRHATDFVHLWVDALCINQHDKEEKSVQIPLMRLIYSHAECVRVWLGPEGGDSDMAIHFVEQCLNLKALDKLVTSKDASPRWDALSALVRRPWFNRRWIIQEIALAKKATVHCGTASVDWRRFAAVVAMLTENKDKLRKLFRESPSHGHHPNYLGELSELGAIRLADVTDNLFRKKANGMISGKLFTLEALMSSLTAFEATEPHDVLYAILWLADDATPVRKSTFTLSATALDIHSPDVDAGFNPSPTQLTFDHSSPFDSVPPDENDSRVDAQKVHRSESLHPSATIKRKRSRSDLSAKSVASDAPEKMGPDSSAPPKRQRSMSDSPAKSTTSHVPGLTVTDTSAPLETGHFLSDSSQKHASWDAPEHNVADVGSPKVIRAAKGLVHKLRRKHIIVDYEKTVFEVCKDFLDFVFHQSKSLDMICLSWAPRDESLPSWIPRLTGCAFAPNKEGIHSRINANSLVKRQGYHATGSRPYNTSQDHPATWYFGIPEQKSLFAKGFIIDRIKQTYDPATNGIIPDAWMRGGGWTDDSKPPPDVFWRTLVGNRNADGRFAPILWEWSCHDAFNRRAIGGPINTSDILLDCPSTVRKFLERVQAMVWGRRLALLERKESDGDHLQFLTLTPARAKRGDLVCLLYGCSVPVVLREMVNGKSAAKLQKAGTPFPKPAIFQYDLIGECYVHNMMNGEALHVKTHHKDRKTFKLI